MVQAERQDRRVIPRRSWSLLPWRKEHILYKPETHSLAPAAAGDNRRLAIGAGQEKFGAMAPVRLIYVVDLDKFKSAGFQESGLYDPRSRILLLCRYRSDRPKCVPGSYWIGTGCVVPQLQQTRRGGKAWLEREPACPFRPDDRICG